MSPHYVKSFRMKPLPKALYVALKDLAVELEATQGDVLSCGLMLMLSVTPEARTEALRAYRAAHGKRG